MGSLGVSPNFVACSLSERFSNFRMWLASFCFWLPFETARRITKELHNHQTSRHPQKISGCAKCHEGKEQLLPVPGLMSLGKFKQGHSAA